MERMPYQCSKCGNWATPVQMPEGSVCPDCARGKHSPNLKTGVVDCHWGMQPSTYSEVVVATSLKAIQAAQDVGQGVLEAIARADTKESLDKQGQRFSDAVERAKDGYSKIPEAIRWAGVFEMPGKADAEDKERYMSFEGMQELETLGRRPSENIVTLRRSMKICTAMQKEADELMDKVRDLSAEVKHAVKNWKEPKVLETSSKK